jgi:hypothetical protein
LREGGAGVEAGGKREELGDEGSESNESFSGSTKVTGVTFGAKVTPLGDAWPIP